MTADEVRDKLARAGLAIASDGRLPNDKGTQIRLTNDANVNVFDNGTVNLQGKNNDEVNAALGKTTVVTAPTVLASQKRATWASGTLRAFASST